MQIYQVGGAVRDLLLGIEPKDRDWVVVGAEQDELITKGYKKVGRAFPVFLHPKTKEEYALARSEKKKGSGHQGFDINFKRMWHFYLSYCEAGFNSKNIDLIQFSLQNR